MRTLAELINGVKTVEQPIQLEANLARLAISDVQIDSREVGVNSAFVALKGERVDGHDYIAAAAARGARAVLVKRGHFTDFTHLGLDRPIVEVDPDLNVIPQSAPANAVFIVAVDEPLDALQRWATRHREQQKLVVVGITGSVGKTSTKEVMAAMLAPTMRTHKSPRSYNSENTLPLVVLGIEPQHQIAVLEMGIYNIGDLALLCEIAKPQIGVVTNIGMSHLERLKTLENVTIAKTELVQSLPADGWAILNYDDKRVLAMREQTQARIFTYGLDPQADLWADNIESAGLDGISFNAHYRNKTWHVKLPLIGLHSVHTALASAAVGIVLGLSWDSLIQGLSNSAQLRLLSYPAVGGATIIDDTYNASPVSSIAALNLLAELNGRRIAVFGDMAELGDQEEIAHRSVGIRAADVVDQLFVYGEKARWIAEEALDSGLKPDQVHIAESKQAIIDQLKAILTKGDFVLVKGSRASEMEEVVAGLQVYRSRG